MWSLVLERVSVRAPEAGCRGLGGGRGFSQGQPPPRTACLPRKAPSLLLTSPLCLAGSFPLPCSWAVSPNSMGHRQQRTWANPCPFCRGPEVPPVTHEEL